MNAEKRRQRAKQKAKECRIQSNNNRDNHVARTSLKPEQAKVKGGFRTKTLAKFGEALNKITGGKK
jgi:hypothetical protein